MTRTRPPARRPSVTRRVEWGNHRFYATIGYDPATGRICEVFYADGQKSGTQMLHTICDACILISRMLQAGFEIHEINRSMSTETDWSGAEQPASLIGAITRALCDEAQEAVHEQADP